MSATIAFLPKSIRSELSQKLVIEINVAAHPPDVAVDSESGNPTTVNHWTLYLVTSAHSSVRCDMTPTGTGPEGTLVVRELDYAISFNAAKYYCISVNPGTSVQTVLDVIMEKHYDRYKFTEGGQGCRYWVMCVLNLLKGKNIVAYGFDEAWAGLGFVWSEEGIPLSISDHTNVIKGYFY